MIHPIRTAAAVSLLSLAIIPFFSPPLGAQSPNTLSDTELTDGWILLFDGETLFGWTPVSDADWKAADGMITASEGSPGLLRTTSQFGDFEFACEYKLSAGGKSGVYLRTSPKPTNLATQAYAVSLGSVAETPPGSLLQRKKAETNNPEAGWQSLYVSAEAGTITVRINGTEVVQYVDPTPAGRGYIALEFAGDPVSFRAIKLKPVGARSLFNGMDLSGWVTYPEMDSVVSVTDKGEMRIRNGKGQIETEGKYGNFILQLQVFVNGDDLNSGVFFRCIPGDVMMGYESQIHNSMIDGDPNRPADCGTGGIFRRQDARKIVAKDFEWFTKTIHVCDNHMAVWVNGIQVSDWTDTRKPHENPRKGLRTEPGTIQLQGHDPTTDFLFKNLRISEIPDRW
jgi:hypothetical protein